jgi:pimeloyl-ACP methyl ester carboxylesterase
MKSLLLCLPILAIIYSCSNPQTYSPRFVVSDDPPFKIKEGQEYTFGYLEVPENRAEPTGDTIRLPVYYFKSRNPNPQPDPIIYTVGGPGGSTMFNAPYMQYYQYLDDRDFILFEQRGTEYAQPHLACPEWEEANYRSGLPGVSEEEANQLKREATQACRDRLVAEDVNLDQYTTRAIAADLADLLTALDLDSFNLLTISYSTKIAQVMMRDHPDGLRSVVMDSALPLAASYDEESTGILMEMLHQLLDDCVRNPECNQAYPDLKERFLAFLRQASEEPLEVTIDHPETGEPELFRLRGKDLIAVFTSAGTGGAPYVPREMERILQGDYTAIREELAGLFEVPATGNGIGARLSVWCAEEFPFADQTVIERETHRYPEIEGLSPAVYPAGICNIWSVQAEPPSENEPVTSDTPVLLINGSYDSDTPPIWAEQMQKYLPNSHHLVFPGWKHVPSTYWSNPCAMTVANAFFNNPRARPEVPCFEQLKEVTFVLPE